MVMVRGYVYSADIWASVVGKNFEKMTNSRLVGGIATHRSLVPSPTPSFSSLLSTVLSSDEKLGVGLGTRLYSPIVAAQTSLARRFHVFDCPIKI